MSRSARPTTYGSTSSRREERPARSPSTCPNRKGPPVSVLPQNDHIDVSLSRDTPRQTCIPQVWTESRLKRSWEKGIRNSAVQPSESMLVPTSHTGSHDESVNSLA